MARTTTRRTRSRVRMYVRGRIPTPNLHAAIKRGQEQNAEMLLRRVKALFAARHMGSGHTVQGFTSRVLADLNLSVSNRRPNARRVEEGVAPRLGAGANQGVPPERVIGPRSTSVLKFRWPRVGSGYFYFPFVSHPGQKADPIMQNTLHDSEAEIEENIRREVVRELNRV